MLAGHRHPNYFNIGNKKELNPYLSLVIIKAILGYHILVLFHVLLFYV
jgi:hypothetical protein